MAPCHPDNQGALHTAENHMTTATDIKIGLALGSGSSRGWSHIGIIKALTARGLEPQVICGASVGAMIGASYLSGKLDTLESWVRASTKMDVLRFFEIKPTNSGLVNVTRFHKFLTDYVAPERLNIEDLKIPFAAVSTDLETGREMWFSQGNLVDAIRASMAMPGLFPPVRYDSRWLVDGGLVDPVPVGVCRALGANLVIAVNLNDNIVGKHLRKPPAPVISPDPQTKGMLANIRQTAREYSNTIFPSTANEDEAPGLFYAIANSINIFQDRITRSRLAGDPADILLTPRLSHIGMLDFHRAAEAIKEGEAVVERMYPDIERTLSHWP